MITVESLQLGMSFNLSYNLAPTIFFPTLSPTFSTLSSSSNPLKQTVSIYVALSIKYSTFTSSKYEFHNRLII